ncbi:MAG: hypothetical protein FJ278_10310, partial [Planctomycetes bacterium]|nr:hypothetical protein [Planctomycetota bacterium]
KTIGKEGGTLKVYLKNNFPYAFRDVRLRAAHDALDVTVEPAVLQRVEPGEKKQLTLTLKPKEGTAAKDYDVRIMLSSAVWRNTEMAAADVSVDALKQYLRGEGNTWAKIVAWELLAMKGEAEGFDALSSTLDRALMFVENERDRTARIYGGCFAAYAFGVLRTSRAVEALTKAAARSDADERLVCAVAWALGHSKDQRALPPLQSLANSQPEPVKISALAGLSLLGQKVDETVFKQALEHRDFMARVHAAGALAMKGQAEGDALLSQSLANKDWGLSTIAGRVMLNVTEARDAAVAKEVASAGGKDAPVAGVPSLDEFSKMPFPRQEQLVLSWGTSQNKEAVPVLVGLLESKSPTLRGHAVTALGRMKEASAVAAIEKLANDDSSPTVKRSASAALKMIRGDQ